MIATFLAPSTELVEVNDDHVASLEQFTILLYDCTSNVVNIDEAHQELFTKKGWHMNAIPPTRAALVQHTKRPVYQGGHCWGKMLESTMCLYLKLKTRDELTHRIGSQCGLSFLR